MPSIIASRSSCAVSMTRGMSRHSARCLMRLHVSWPDNPGMTRSSRMPSTGTSTVIAYPASSGISQATAHTHPLQFAKVGNAGLHQIPVHFHEVILDASGFGRNEKLLPVDGARSDGDHFPLRRPVREMERNKPARIFSENSDGVVLEGDGVLELHFNQLGIHPLHQLIVNEYSVDLLELEVVIVEAKLKAGLVGLCADLVHVVESFQPA